MCKITFLDLQTPWVERAVPCSSPHPVFGNKSFFIHHVEFVNESAPIQVPIILVHGWGGGKGFWVENIDALAQIFRTIYAVDLLVEIFFFGHVIGLGTFCENSI